MIIKYLYRFVPTKLKNNISEAPGNFAVGKHFLFGKSSFSLVYRIFSNGISCLALHWGEDFMSPCPYGAPHARGERDTPVGSGGAVLGEGRGRSISTPQPGVLTLSCFSK